MAGNDTICSYKSVLARPLLWLQVRKAVEKAGLRRLERGMSPVHPARRVKFTSDAALELGSQEA